MKRMPASWSGSHADPTEYKVAARCFARKAGSPRIAFGHIANDYKFDKKERVTRQIESA